MTSPVLGVLNSSDNGYWLNVHTLVGINRLLVCNTGPEIKFRFFISKGGAHQLSFRINHTFCYFCNLKNPLSVQRAPADNPC